MKYVSAVSVAGVAVLLENSFMIFKSTIINSNIVANDYLKLKSENLENNIQSISKDIYNLIVINSLKQNQLNRINLNHNTKKLEDIFIFNNKNEIISFSSITNSDVNFLPPTKETLKVLNSGKVYILQKEKTRSFENG